jgi:hypothetical protein
MKYKAPKQFAFIDGSGRFRRGNPLHFLEELKQ